MKNIPQEIKIEKKEKNISYLSNRLRIRRKARRLL